MVDVLIEDGYITRLLHLDYFIRKKHLQPKLPEEMLLVRRRLSNDPLRHQHVADMDDCPDLPIPICLHFVSVICLLNRVAAYSLSKELAPDEAAAALQRLP